MGAADYLACQVAVQGVDRAAGEGGVVGEEPLEDVLVAVLAVTHHGDHAGEHADDLVFGVEEAGRECRGRRCGGSPGSGGHAAIGAPR